MNKHPTKISTRGAAALVVSNMIGTGVFTSLGFQLQDLSASASILLLWLIGGIIAVAGAFAYAELGAYFGKSGGEYHYLSKLYHPAVGYLSGWVSLTVGFAAPVALAAMAMAAYVAGMVSVAPVWTATIVVVAISMVHSLTLRHSEAFQGWTTLIKILLMLLFIVAGLLVAPGASNALDWSAQWRTEIWSPAFAIALVYVSYAYSGWNAAAYIVEEIHRPVRSLPIALAGGTALVAIMYVLLHFVFLKHASIPEMAGQIEIGQIVATNLFGTAGGRWISVAIAVFLISSISAMIWVGPRVSMVMADDHALWRFLGLRNAHGIPVRAIWFQSALSLLLVWTGTFEVVLLYCGFILQVFTVLAVGGAFLLRKRAGVLPFKNPTHPWLPALFIGVGIWVLIYLVVRHPVESMWGTLNLLIGWITYLVSKNRQK